jgi:hypothetical protein
MDISHIQTHKKNWFIKTETDKEAEPRSLGLHSNIFPYFQHHPPYCHFLTWYNFLLMLYKPNVAEYQNEKKTHLNKKRIAV